MLLAVLCSFGRALLHPELPWAGAGQAARCPGTLDVFAWQTREEMALNKAPTVGSSPVRVHVLDPPPREGWELGSCAEPLPEQGFMCL